VQDGKLYLMEPTTESADVFALLEDEHFNTNSRRSQKEDPELGEIIRRLKNEGKQNTLP
jgi:hypothetical protein